jgi:hypothetical protein
MNQHLYEAQRISMVVSYMTIVVHFILLFNKTGINKSLNSIIGKNDLRIFRVNFFPSEIINLSRTVLLDAGKRSLP